MSRSIKKPYLTQQQRSRKSANGQSNSSYWKRKANRAVRKANKQACEENEAEELKDGKSYRKASCSYNIRDWSFHDPKNPKAKRK